MIYEIDAIYDDLDGKIGNLNYLARKGFPVPPGIFLSGKAYKSFATPLKKDIFSVLAKCDTLKASAKIRDIFLNQDISTLTQEIEKHLASNQSLYAVRSSSICYSNGKYITEDSHNNSLAGQFESYLNVELGDVPEMVKKCWSSLFNERSLKKFDVLNDPEYIESEMCVIIQEMVNAEKSFVVMTRDPLQNKYLGIEAVRGPCEYIVSGEVTGDLYLMNRNDGSVIEFESGGNRTEKVLSLDELNQVFNISMDIENSYAMPMDIEGVINESVHVVQARPITTLGGK